MKRRFEVLGTLVSLAALGALAGCTRSEPVKTPPRAARTPHVLASAEPPPRVTRSRAARDGSAVLLAELDDHLVAYVADEDDALVRVLDVEDGHELSRVSPGGAPSELVMLADGRVIATLRDAGEVVVLKGGGSERSRLAVDKRIPVASEPIGLALSPDDARLVVTSGWAHAVTVLDVATWKKTSEVSVAREPRSVVVAKDGRRAFVSHAVGQSLDVVPLDGTNAKQLVASGSEEIGGRHGFLDSQPRAACQGFAIARADSGRVFAPHVLAFMGNPQETSSGYGGGEGREAEVFQVPVVDEDAAAVVPESMVLHLSVNDTIPKCALPRAATVGKAGLFVTCLGADAVALYDASAVNPHEVELRRWAVPSGPTGIALDEAHERAVVWSQFAHTLTTLAVGSGERAPRPFALSSFSVPRATRVSAMVERGRALFHATKDPRISSDGRACASCHPDGRDDTLVWSSPKGPRQTPMLAGRLEGAAPYGWNGDADTVSTHLVATFKRLGGTGVTGEDKAALMAYVAAMRPPPPAPAKADRAALARGGEIFRSAEAGCAGCHGATGDLPDGTKHDVRSTANGDVQSKFDTPSLRFVGGTAPYFHDGRYKDLKTLLIKSDGKMGHTKQLSPSELADLTTYLESL